MNSAIYRLITIPASHYCEKVRWALDWLKIPYIEERLGLYEDEMKRWLTDKGFREVEILQQDELEVLFLGKRTLPSNM